MASGDKRNARMEMITALRDVFKRYTRGSRAAAWKSLSSSSGKQEVAKVLNNTNRPLSRFRNLSFREWLSNESGG